MGLLSKIFPARKRTGHDELLRLLDAADTHPQARPAFYHALLDATLYVPGQNDGNELFLRPYQVEGRNTLLVFSSPQNMHSALRTDPGSVQITGRTALTAVLSTSCQSVILNLATRNQKEFTLSEIRALLDGSMFAPPTGNQGPALLIGTPRESPVRLIDQLILKLPAKPDVRAAYVARITPVDADSQPVADGQMVIAFDTDMDDDAFSALCANARRIAGAVQEDGVEFVRMNCQDALGQYLEAEGRPFYQRQPQR